MSLLGAYDTLADLIAAHPTGNTGDAYAVGGVVYVWDTATSSWKPAGNVGVTGPTGPTGPVGTILGSYDTLDELKNAHPSGNQGDAYLVDGALYIWNTDTLAWESVGDLRGPSAPVELQFSSVTAPRVVSGITGDRAGTIAVGLGFEENTSTTDPVILNHPAVSVKSLAGGTITEIHIALSVSVSSGEATDSTVYAQLYTASAFNSREFFPVENTLMTLQVPSYPPIGTTRTASLTDLSIDIAPGTQLVLGFYNTSTNVSYGINAYLGGVVKITR